MTETELLLVLIVFLASSVLGYLKAARNSAAASPNKGR